MYYYSEECVICFCDNPNILFNPCNHICVCSTCSVLISTLPCPLCRQDIVSKEERKKEGIQIDTTEFKEKHREEYMRRFVSSNAGYKGKSKQARAVGSYMENELLVREMETKGTERLTCKGVDFTTKEGYVTYKCGRRKVEEVCKEQEKNIPEDVESVLDIATRYPDLYWTFYKECNGKDIYGFIESLIKK